MASAWVQFRDKAEAIIGIGARVVFPLLGAFAPVLGLPAWVGTVAGSVVPQLMAIAEKDLPAAGSGPMKKAKVLDATEQILAILEKTFTGHAAADFAKLRPTLELLIDGTVSATNLIAPSIVADDKPGLTAGEQAP